VGVIAVLKLASDKAFGGFNSLVVTGSLEGSESVN